MSFNEQRPEMIASGSCFGVILLALLVKRAVRNRA
jgi:hypothetical protein